MKKLVLSAVAVLASSFAYGQNMAVYKAEEQFNEEKFVEAEKTIIPALTNPKTKKLDYAYNLAGKIESRLLQKEIEKAARNEPLDTTLFINCLNRAVEFFTKSDEIEKAPDAKGKVKSKLEFHAENKKMIGQMMTYYAYAGQFENQRGNREGAYKAFCQYIEMPKNPVYTKAQTDSIYKANAETYNKIGYYAAMLAYEMKDFDGVLKTVDFAIADPVARNDGYMMKLASHLAKKDTASWVKTSREAVAAIDNNPVYCNNLLFYYNSKKLNDEAKAMADELVQKAPNNKMAYYARGCVSMNTFKKYAEARQDFDKAIELDENFVEAIYNKGVSFVNELISLNLNTDTKSKDYQQTLEKARGYYSQAKPLFEKVQMLVPEKKELWAENLRSIYFNLDMKEKAKEMEDIIANK